MTAKTQRERDLMRAREVLANIFDCPGTPTLGTGAAHVADAIAEAREHGRRDSDVWRAAMAEAIRIVERDADTHAKRAQHHHKENVRLSSAMHHDIARHNEAASDALKGIAHALGLLAGTEPPRTYEDGLREGLRRAAALVDRPIASLTMSQIRAIVDGIEALASDLPEPPRSAFDRLMDLISQRKSSQTLAASRRPSRLALATASIAYAGTGANMADIEIAKELWTLLDHIDTLDDACRGNDAAFRAHTRSFVAKRHALLETDGYTLRRIGEQNGPATPPEQPRSAAPDETSGSSLKRPRADGAVREDYDIGSRAPWEESAALTTARQLLAELVKALVSVDADEYVSIDDDHAREHRYSAALEAARAYLGTPEAPPRTAAEPEKL